MTRRGPVGRRAAHRETPLQHFLDARHIRPAKVHAKLQERMGDEAPDEKQFRRWRLGRAEPMRKNMVRLLWAVREAADDPDVRIEDIIDLDPNNPANWKD